MHEGPENQILHVFTYKWKLNTSLISAHGHKDATIDTGDGYAGREGGEQKLKNYWVLRSPDDRIICIPNLSIPQYAHVTNLHACPRRIKNKS